MRCDARRLLILGTFAAALGGCGQKGPLYLPDKMGNVVTRPAGETTQAPPQTAPAPAATPDSTTVRPGSKEEDQKPK